MRDFLLNTLKFILFVLFIPIIMAATRSFYKEFLNLEQLAEFFLYGMMAYLILHHFIYVPQGFYQFGQKITSSIFRFSAFLAATLPALIPIFASLLLLGLLITTQIFRIVHLKEYFFFFVGFTFLMHMILTAQTLYAEDTSVVKPHYFFMMSLSYTIGLIILALCIHINCHSFSFLNYLKRSCNLGKDLYVSVYHQLFIH